MSYDQSYQPTRVNRAVSEVSPNDHFLASNKMLQLFSELSCFETEKTTIYIVTLVAHSLFYLVRLSIRLFGFHLTIYNLSVLMQYISKSCSNWVTNISRFIRRLHIVERTYHELIALYKSESYYIKSQPKNSWYFARNSNIFIL